ncbi:MAG: hypothetical protein HC916_01510 [Coleofasciculaceae cyanobacterium SM2_1_6]|nr:hypothetical protein [Coleofasciculaceae cyanobacterium SM2_1_6]
MPTLQNGYKYHHQGRFINRLYILGLASLGLGSWGQSPVFADVGAEMVEVRGAIERETTSVEMPGLIDRTTETPIDIPPEPDIPVAIDIPREILAPIPGEVAVEIPAENPIPEWEIALSSSVGSNKSLIFGQR